MFCDEQARALFADWPTKARDLVAFLHLDAERHADDPALADLIGELSVHSELFRHLWTQHRVHDKGHAAVKIVHPVVGTMQLSDEALRLPGDPDQTLVTYRAEPASAALLALRLLAPAIPR